MDCQSSTKEEISPETWETAKVDEGSLRMDFFSGLSQICFANTDISMSVLAIPYHDAGKEKKEEEAGSRHS